MSDLQWPEYITSNSTRYTLSDYLTGVLGIPNQSILVQAGFVAASAQAIVTGAVIFFVVRYYQLCRDDGKPTKALVGAMTFLAVLELVITDVDVARIVWNVGNYAKVYRSNQILSVLSVFINGFSTLLMQMSFIRRAWILWHRNWTVGGSLALLTLGSFAAINFAFAAALTCPVYGEHTTRKEALDSMPAFLRYGNLFMQATKAQSFLLIASDFAITIAIIAGLLRSRTGFRETDNLVMRLAVAVTESMIAPLVLGVAYVGFVIKGNGPSSWLRVSASMQPAVYLHAVVCSLLLRTRAPAFRSGNVSSGRISNRAAPTTTNSIKMHAAIPMDKLDKLEDEEEPEVEFYMMQNAPSRNKVFETPADDTSDVGRW